MVTCGALSQSTGRRLIYAVSLNSTLIWRSANNGASWTFFTVTDPTNGAMTVNGRDFVDVATSPIDPDTVYVMSGNDRKIRRSTNGGRTWTDITNNFPGPPGNAAGMWSQTTYNWSLEVSTRMVGGQPVDVIYASVLDMAMSDDAGATWKTIGKSYLANAETHNDQQTMAILPGSPDSTLAGNDGGVYLTRYAAGNVTYFGFNNSPQVANGFGITQFYHASWHPTDPNIMLGGCQDNCTSYCNGDLATWTNPGDLGDGNFCAIAPSRPATQYAAGYYDSMNNLFFMVRTANSWGAQADINLSFNGGEASFFFPPIAVDPSNADRLYAGSNRLYRRDDPNAWAQFSPTQLGNALTYIAISDRNPRYVYTGSGDGQLWLTKLKADGTLDTQTQINAGTNALPATRPILGIAVDPTNEKRVLVCLGGAPGADGGNPGRVWICDNVEPDAGMRTWANKHTAVLPDVNANAIAFSPATPATEWYIASDMGFFYTKNGGTAWKDGTGRALGLPLTICMDVKAPSGTTYVNVATFGRGFWRARRGDLP